MDVRGELADLALEPLERPILVGSRDLLVHLALLR
jgi:hypothetical protein